jgi:acyl carrier protein
MAYTTEQIRAEIKALIAKVSEREADEIADEAKYQDELGIDSLMGMEIMIAVDRKFKIDIPEEEFAQATCVNESVALVEKWLSAKEATAIATA